MEYRRLGRTEIEVSEPSFGSHLNKANKADPEGRRRQIQAGIDCGINLFDIYEHSYQQFEPMSVALDAVRDEVVISLVTVWRAADEVMDEVEYALEVFKRDTIDLFRLVLKGDPEDAGQRMESLVAAKEQGKIRAIGGVVHYPQHLVQGLEQFPDELDYMLVPASFCAPLALDEGRELAPLMTGRDLGIIAMKAMAAADDAGGYIHKLQPGGDEMAQLRAKGLSLGKLAVKYLLQSPIVASVLPAMNSIDEVREDASACGDGSLTADEKRFLEIYREEADRVFPDMLGKDNYWVSPWTL